MSLNIFREELVLHKSVESTEREERRKKCKNTNISITVFSQKA